MRKEISINNKAIKLLRKKKFLGIFIQQNWTNNFYNILLIHSRAFPLNPQIKQNKKSLNLYQISSSFSDTKVFQIEIAESINRVVKVFDNISCW